MLAAAAALYLLLAGAGGQRPAPDAEAAVQQNLRRQILSIEDGRNPTASELRLLLDIARRGRPRSADADRAVAIRALGRLERRSLIPVLLELAQSETGGGPASVALLVTLRAHTTAAGDSEVNAATDSLLRLTQSAIILAHLPYTNRDQVQLAETKLMALGGDRKEYAAVAAGLEVLARRHRRLHQLEDETIDFLRRAVGRSLPAMEVEEDLTPLSALAAIAAAGRADEEMITTGLRDRSGQVRRLAAMTLASAGVAIEPSKRTELTRSALGDPSYMVRHEAVRGWSRRETPTHGCGPLAEALSDRSMHVVLAAIDALGDVCRDDDVVTNRIVSEARTPPTIGDWQREAHALVALAKRSPERAAIAMPAFISHQVWQVRMYAARAAAAMKDAASLDRLVYDADDNVREAALGPLRTLKGSNSDAAVLDALGRTDYQLLRTAAMLLKDAQPDKYLAAGLAAALVRVTAETKDTSRDTRLALLERLRALGGREQLSLYERLLKDFDPMVAAAAAEACAAVSRRACAADPQPAHRPPPPSPGELNENIKAVVRLDTGRSFDIVFNKDVAPLAYSRFIRLVRAHYYDGLTFHRIVPNFVIQGGSPGANEYAGDGPFMRDELGGSHQRGTVGISTRGRDTGDAQIFINLVDNPRLDFDYTAFASVGRMETIDGILEGTRIRRITLLPVRP